MAMNKTSARCLAFHTAAFAIAFGNVAYATGPDRVAQLGLVPADTVSRPALKGTVVLGHPGLRQPRARSLGIALDGLKTGEVGRALLYTGTRSFPSTGAPVSHAVGGMLYPLSGNWYSTVETTVDAGSARPYRGHGLVGQLHRALPGGWDMSFGLHYNVSEVGTTGFQTGGPDPMTLGARAWSLYPPAAYSSAATGYELRLNYRYGERNTLGVTYGSGGEFDYTRQFLGMQPADGRQFGLTGEHWLSPAWALNYGVMASEQVGQYRGQGLRLGLRYRF